MAILTPEDLAPFATIDEDKAELMIDDAEAMAALAAPCISTDEFQDDATLMAALRAVLRAAILRWLEAGTGAVTQHSAGPFAQTLDTRQIRKGMFWPSEIAQLQELCARHSGEAGGRQAFSIRPSGRGGAHSTICALTFGALYCSCGSDLNRLEGPLWEGGLLTPDPGPEFL